MLKPDQRLYIIKNYQVKSNREMARDLNIHHWSVNNIIKKLDLKKEKRINSGDFKKGYTPWNKGKEQWQTKGDKNPRWNGGKRITRGYIQLFVDGEYKFEHRLVMEKHLGRPLNDNEVVHHINRDPKDNRVDNLQVHEKEEHCKLHYPNRSKFGINVQTVIGIK